LANVKLDVFVHRSGQPVSGATIKIRTANGNTYSSEPVSSDGTATVNVPENERFNLVIEPF
jgi:phosphatidylserine decarboxylase